MAVRPLGNTGITVSEIGFGANRLGESHTSDADWDALVARALDLGVTVFDTAEAYGKGRSEEVIGRVVGDNPDICIATKYSPRRSDDGADFSYDTLDASLDRLRRPYADVYQLHSPRDHELASGEWHDTLYRLKEEGRIRHVAVAVNRADEGVPLIEQGVVEVLQVTYNLIDRAVEERLLPLALEKGVGLLVRKPLSRGVLTGKFRPGESVADHHRASLDGDALGGRIENAERFRSLGDAYPGGLTRLAHHFSLSHPAVSCTIPGARTIEQLEENCAASDDAGLPADIRAQL